MTPFPPTFPVVVAEFAQPPSQPDLVDAVEAAEMLGTTLLNVRQMTHKKKLTPLGKRGRRNVYARDEVAALVEARRKEPREPDQPAD